MPYYSGFPNDPLVLEIAEMLDRGRSVAEIWDSELRQVFVTGEYLRAVGVASVEQLGTLGLEIFDAEMFAARARWPWPAGQVEELAGWYATYGGLFVRQVGIERIRAVAPLEVAAAFAAADPEREWGMCELLGVQQVGELTLPFRANVTAVFGLDGRLRCVVSVVGPAISGHVLAMLSFGDVANFERLTRLIQPDVRPAAILFVDLEGSTRIARELPTRAYFEFIARFVSTFDACAVEHAGVVGKHAGDGASAFFLVQECGSASRAAAAAIRTARDATARFANVAADAGFERDTLRLNAAVHWGERVLVGNVVSAARLEATAFGEEVNEAARVESVAKGGTLLATKALIERLDAADAAALEIDPHVGAYTLIADLPGAGEKARRDAGSLPVRVLAS